MIPIDAWAMALLNETLKYVAPSTCHCIDNAQNCSKIDEVVVETSIYLESSRLSMDSSTRSLSMFAIAKKGEFEIVEIGVEEGVDIGYGIKYLLCPKLVFLCVCSLEDFAWVICQ